MVALLMSAGAYELFLWENFRIIVPEPVTTARHAPALAEAVTLCVSSISFTRIFYLLNCRPLCDSLFTQGIFSSPSIFSGVGLLLLLCFVYLPPLQSLFCLAAIDGRA